MYILIWDGRLDRYDTYKDAVDVAKYLTKDEEENKKALIIKDSFFTEVEEISWAYDSTWSTKIIEY